MSYCYCGTPTLLFSIGSSESDGPGSTTFFDLADLDLEVLNGRTYFGIYFFSHNLIY